MHNVIYAAARNRIRSGDLLAWQGHGFESRLVRAFTGSSYSHVGIAWVVAGRVFVLEAALSGVRIFPLSQKPSFYWIRLRAVQWSEKAELLALANIGDPYSRWEAIKGFLRIQLDDQTWQCAEYAIAILDSLGCNLRGVNATPESLVDWAQQCAGSETIFVKGA